MEQQQRLRKRMKRRHRAETRFRWYGRLAVGLALAALVCLLYNIIAPGISGFTRHEIIITTDTEIVTAAQENPQKAAVDTLVKLVPDIQGDKVKRRKLATLLSASAADRLQEQLSTGDAGAESEANGDSTVTLLGNNKTVSLPLSDKADQYLKGHGAAGLTEVETGWLDALRADGHIESHLNRDFLTQGDSREPEMAGFLGSMVGSLLSLAVCLSLALVIGVLTAIYLEEFAPRNRLTVLIEVNIANLAAVPSIIFGLLGLTVFLQFFGLPRSSALAGGLTLALMTLPVIIISARASLKAVPPSIRDAARGLGASPLQVVMHHVVPYALPGMLTGVILGMARAIGETAPLLMIGMVAFIADVPQNFLDPATAMPVQIYIWASSPEAGFVEKTSTGIIVLLMMLMLMNATAVILRRRFEIKW